MLVCGVAQVHVQMNPVAQIEGMSDMDMLDFYEHLARDVCAESVEVRGLLERLVANAKPKHDTSINMSKAVRHRDSAHSTCLLLSVFAFLNLHVPML